MEVLVREFLSAENARDWAKWASFVSDDVTYTVVGSGNVVTGKSNYVAYMQKVYAELSDWHFVIETVATGADAVIVEFRGRGRFTGAHGGRMYTGARLELSAVCVFWFRDDRIASVREYFDQASQKTTCFFGAALAAVSQYQMTSALGAISHLRLRLNQARTNLNSQPSHWQVRQ